MKKCYRKPKRKNRAAKHRNIQIIINKAQGLDEINQRIKQSDEFHKGANENLDYKLKKLNAEIEILKDEKLNIHSRIDKQSDKFDEIKEEFKKVYLRIEQLRAIFDGQVLDSKRQVLMNVDDVREDARINKEEIKQVGFKVKNI